MPSNEVQWHQSSFELGFSRKADRSATRQQATPRHACPGGRALRPMSNSSTQSGKLFCPQKASQCSAESRPFMQPGSLQVEETPELLRAGRVAQLAQRLGFYLPDSLARDVELLADLFERVIGVHVDTEAHP